MPYLRNWVFSKMCKNLIFRISQVDLFGGLDVIPGAEAVCWEVSVSDERQHPGH